MWLEDQVGDIWLDMWLDIPYGWIYAWTCGWTCGCTYGWTYGWKTKYVAYGWRPSEWHRAVIDGTSTASFLRVHVSHLLIHDMYTLSRTLCVWTRLIWSAPLPCATPLLHPVLQSMILLLHCWTSFLVPHHHNVTIHDFTWLQVQ